MRNEAFHGGGAVRDESLHDGEQCVMKRFTVCTVGRWRGVRDEALHGVDCWPETIKVYK